jgi:hypothetical protein
VNEGEPNLGKAVGGDPGGLTSFMSRRRTRNQIKGLAERYLECSIPPGAVRKDEVQETPLLPWLLPLEQGWCTASEFEKLDALVQVGPVCCLVFLDRSKNPIF